MYVEKISPRVYETDAFGHINNTVIPGWFEKGREPIFKLFTPDLDLRKLPLIIARIEVDFLAEMHYGKEVEIRTQVLKLGNSSMHVVQEAWQKGACAARGVCVMTHFDYASRRSTAIPPAIRKELEKHAVVQAATALTKTF